MPGEQEPRRAFRVTPRDVYEALVYALLRLLGRGPARVALWRDGLLMWPMLLAIVVVEAPISLRITNGEWSSPAIWKGIAALALAIFLGSLSRHPHFVAGVAFAAIAYFAVRRAWVVGIGVAAAIALSHGIAAYLFLRLGPTPGVWESDPPQFAWQGTVETERHERLLAEAARYLGVIAVGFGLVSGVQAALPLFGVQSSFYPRVPVGVTLGLFIVVIAFAWVSHARTPLRFALWACATWMAVLACVAAMK